MNNNNNNNEDFPLEACKRFLEHQFPPDLVLPIYKWIDVPTPKTKRQLIRCVDRWMDDPTSYTHHIGCWDTSNITDFSFVCCADRNGKMAHFDEVIKWNFSNAVNMDGTFNGCSEFKGMGADQWDVSQVTYMRATFNGCRKLNGDVSGWTVSSVTTMAFMFYCCESFNCDLSAWEVSNVTGMDYMLDGCNSLLRKPIWHSRRRLR